MVFSAPFRKVTAVLALIITTLFVYSSVFKADYQNWDDPGHVLIHPLVVQGKWLSLGGVFLKEDTVNRTYIPLTAASFFLEKKVFGLSAFSSHAINIILYVLVVVLVLVFSRRMGLSFLASYIAAVLFAVHPMHVEPVAWITARKDLLCAVFYLLSLILYCRFLRTKRGDFYIVSLLMACLSVFSKPMALSLPLVLILIDLIQGRAMTWRIFFEKAPFLIVVVMIAGITYVLNSQSADITFPGSFLIWGWSAFFYLKKFFFPVGLSVLYAVPQPVSFLNSEYWGAWLGIVFLMILLYQRRKDHWFVFALCFYVLSIFFLWRLDIRLTEMVADRYMFLPGVGICLFIGYVAGRLMHEQRWRIITTAVLAVVFSLLMVMTFRQTGYWKNSWTLWSRTLELRPDLYYARFMRSGAVLDERFESKTARDFENFVEDSLPARPRTPYHHGLVREKMRFFKALYGIRWYHRGLSKGLWRADEFQQIPVQYIYLNYGMAFSLIEDHQKALVYYQKMLNRGQLNVSKLEKMAACYFSLGQYSMSEEYFNRAIRLESDNYDVLFSRAGLFAFTGQMGRALEDAERLLKIDAQDQRAYHLLFNICLSMNKPAQAKMVLDRELALWPRDPQVIWHRGVFAQKTGDKAAAAGFFARARQLGYVP